MGKFVYARDFLVEDIELKPGLRVDVLARATKKGIEATTGNVEVTHGPDFELISVNAFVDPLGNGGWVRKNGEYIFEGEEEKLVLAAVKAYYDGLCYGGEDGDYWQEDVDD